MRKLIVALLSLCFTSVAFGYYEKQEEALQQWLAANPEIDKGLNIQVETEAHAKVSLHKRDDLSWADNCVNGITLWSSGPNPVPGAVKALAAGVLTLGIWPGGCLAAAGCARLAEKAVQKFDYRWQDAEYKSFTSELNHQRYIADRLLLLIGGTKASRVAGGSSEWAEVFSLYSEWATWVGLPLEEGAIKAEKVVVDTLALRVNTEIHKHKPAVPREPINF